MATETNDWAALKTMRDELRLKAHLAAMDLRTEWERFEPQLERALNNTKIVSKELRGDLAKRLAEFRQRMG